MAAVEEGTFTKAASRCYISQTAISQQIAAIEKELDVKLFDRSQYRPRLTPAGTRFYLGCKHLLEQFDKTLEEVKAIARQEKREMNIGITGMFERLMLTNILKRYVEEYPDLKINIVQNRIHDCLKKMETGTLDILFVLKGELKNSQNLDVVPMTEQKMCIITSSNHRLANRKEVKGKELKDEEFIVFSRESSYSYHQAFLEGCRKDGFEPKIVQEVESPYDIMVLVSLGKGISITSNQVYLDKCMVCTVPLVDSAHQGEYCVVKSKHNNAKETTDFIEIAKRECAGV